MTMISSLDATVAISLLGAALAFPLATQVHAQAEAKQKRFPQLTMDQLNDQQRPLAEEILKVSSVGLAGPYNPMMRSPIMGERLFQLLDYLRFKTSLPRRLNEFSAHTSQRRRPA
jgi:4-carboxymuconolactone decarboxylase